MACREVAWWWLTATQGSHSRAHVDPTDVARPLMGGQSARDGWRSATISSWAGDVAAARTAKWSHGMQERKEGKVRRDLFWDADLEDIERSFLQGKTIVELPIKTDDRIPPQGIVLLRRVTRLGAIDTDA